MALPRPADGIVCVTKGMWLRRRRRRHDQDEWVDHKYMLAVRTTNRRPLWMCWSGHDQRKCVRMRFGPSFHVPCSIKPRRVYANHHTIHVCDARFRWAHINAKLFAYVGHQQTNIDVSLIFGFANTLVVVYIAVKVGPQQTKKKKQRGLVRVPNT